MAQAVALVIGILGVAGVIFTALRYNRDDSTATVSQQAAIVTSMHTLNDELRATNEDLKQQVRELREQIELMRKELRNGRADP